MNLTDHLETLNLKTLTNSKLQPEVTCGYAGDLLSDVMANAQEGCALITIQAHKNTVAVATLVGASAIVICNSRTIPEDMTKACTEEGLGLFQTTDNQFTFSGKLFQILQG